MDWHSANTPLIIAHRGASADAPENTVVAFALASEQGAHGVELDVRLSADGNVVIMHDSTVDRTTDGSGAVAALTADELRALDAGQGQPVPTLDQVFEAFGPSMLYNIELKNSALLSHDMELAVADRIAAHHLENQVAVSSFNPLAVRRARRHLSASTIVGLVRQRRPRTFRHFLANAGADHPHYSLVDEAYMRWARRRAYRVHVWTVDDAGEARRLAALGVHGIITNRPALVRDAL
ncbi:MAG TPA: glycerophosphodiester phosphodiesterase family protein [Candidatus Sulfomarinibacteraceae bacterium]|nr:glycerophosphodiester phosphodiesterase family protein [Candidatus Sulfomarinibacteraceae bacterium]